MAGVDLQKDHWSSEAYKNAASFTPALTHKVCQDLDIQPSERLLDIGCGDGVLTSKFASIADSVVGLDASRSFIKSANETFVPAHRRLKFFEYDCRRLDDATALDGRALASGTYDKVFSNAAMHWILRDQTIRQSFFADVYRLLRPGGSFVFELGGAGNVSEAHTALISVLQNGFNISMDRIREVDPWFFPSEQWMRQTLESSEFEAVFVQMEYRPTTLTPEKDDGSGGLQGWVRLMGAPFLAVLKDDDEREKAIRQVCEVLENVVTRVEDGSKQLGYVRLRAMARKPT